MQTTRPTTPIMTTAEALLHMERRIHHSAITRLDFDIMMDSWDFFSSMHGRGRHWRHAPVPAPVKITNGQRTIDIDAIADAARRSWRSDLERMERMLELVHGPALHALHALVWGDDAADEMSDWDITAQAQAHIDASETAGSSDPVADLLGNIEAAIEPTPEPTLEAVVAAAIQANIEGIIDVSGIEAFIGEDADEAACAAAQTIMDELLDRLAATSGTQRGRGL